MEIAPDLNMTYTPEGTALTSDRIRLGDTTTDQRGVESEFGTLGVIRIDPKGFGDQPYGTTASHALLSIRKISKDGRAISKTPDIRLS